jgi:hypothetical protein
MKKLILIALLSLPFASSFAGNMKCLSDDERYEIRASLDVSEKIIHSMEYFKDGKSYMKFSALELDISKGKKKDSYEVLFYKGALYLGLERAKNADGSLSEYASGEFLPKNSILSFERKIDCLFY